MDVVDLDDATNQLYSLNPAEFTARRGELAAQAREAGLTEVAKAVSGLRRPTVAAWLVNSLTRADGAAGDDVERLAVLGAQLREAQAQLDGPRMKDLTRQRHELVAILVGWAGEAAAAGGLKVSASVQRELEETFGAAVADEQASVAVTSGRLTRALVYSGLGEVDVRSATATPLGAAGRPPRNTVSKKPPSEKKQPGEKSDRGADSGTASETADDRAQAAARADRQRAAEAIEQAKAALAAAEHELIHSAHRRQELQTRQTALSSRLEELQREIVQARRDLDVVERSQVAADRDFQRQERHTREARKALHSAEQLLAKLEPT
jgi:hypothetical protein